MNRHGLRHPLRTPVLLLLALVVLDVAAYVIDHAALLLVVLGSAGVVLWRARQRRPAAPARPVLRLADDHDRLAAELDDARRQVAKLERDAAKHDELLERLERVTGRPVELHLADLERVRRQYGPAAVGKTGEAAMTGPWWRPRGWRCEACAWWNALSRIACAQCGQLRRAGDQP